MKKQWFYKLPRVVWLVAAFLTLSLMFGTANINQTLAADATCPGSLSPQLTSVGQSGRIAQYFSKLRDVPAGTPIAVRYTPSTFTVVSPSECHYRLYWVQIKYNVAAGSAPLIGWALESQVYSQWGWNKYWLEPDNPGTPPGDCYALFSLPGVLQVGNRGRIVHTYSTLRRYPGGPDVLRVNSPAAFFVEDVSCVNGFRWLKISYDHLPLIATMWALESERYGWWGPSYWLEPD